ncbi:MULTISPECIES: DUF192 domain-containing protein [unclassified Modicisalibacter]|uniref:DUF192 domain-containing protein n=1 Tax=unclassified Modicisalibacter TaxID=2679913 RepID=UPI001CCF1FED|nr:MULTISPECIES: DUF192 domain-containing protein [unclassified Modicisalibacter]MBZ9559839.1 DUF192 domain-containing protein [Modicisalibacter sp. R2A 31.J]MBZ9577291.1 DUF192 domain-containing protein [Modicisalibacter sp. MOD 31.J]
MRRNAQANRLARWLWASGLGLSASLAGGDVRAESLPLTLEGDAQRTELSVEIADDPAERNRGLMARDHLAADAGMLFVYPRSQSPQGAFWMYRTRIPLDIAFLDASGVIRAIRHMVPCPSERSADCPSYAAGVAFRAALEVNAGFFADHGIDVGDRIVSPPW